MLSSRGAKLVYAAAGGVMAIAAIAPTPLLSEGRSGGGSGIWAVMRSEQARVSPMARPLGYAPQFRVGIPFFEDRRSLRPMTEGAVRKTASAQQRFVCMRLCDGRQLVLGFDATGVSSEEYAAMCAAAGQDSETVLLTSRIGAAEVSLRDARGEEAHVTEATPASLLERVRGERQVKACAPSIAERPLSVPIEADRTLEAGDVVATANGFKVFVGSAAAPHTEASFVDIGDAKRLTKQHRSMVDRLAIND